jgi:hypothetical protein
MSNIADTTTIAGGPHRPDLLPMPGQFGMFGRIVKP